MAKKVPANLVSREELLTRDVGILFIENNDLKNRIAELEKEKAALLDEVDELKARIIDDERGELAFWIKSQREALGMSRGAMARALGVVDQTLANYEKGKGKLENMEKVAEGIRQLRRSLKSG